MTNRRHSRKSLILSFSLQTYAENDKLTLNFCIVSTATKYYLVLYQNVPFSSGQSKTRTNEKTYKHILFDLFNRLIFLLSNVVFEIALNFFVISQLL